MTLIMSKKTDALINRDLSWLSFNARVLQEAEDTAVPLLERIRFLGIFSSNRDEFFKVRVATIRRMTKWGKKGKLLIGTEPEKLLEKITEKVVEQQKKFDLIYNSLQRDLKKVGILILDEKKLDLRQEKFAREYFHEQIFPFLVPIMIDTAPKFPYLKDKTLYLAVKITHRHKENKSKYSLIEVPTDILSRFVILPSTPDRHCIILLEDIIRLCLGDIYSIFDYRSVDAWSIKLTRDAELDIESDVSKSWIEKITKSVNQRKKGEPVRLVYDEKIPEELLELILKKIKLRDKECLIPGGRYHNFKDFVSFPRLKNGLWYPNHIALDHPQLINQRSAIHAISKKDILLAYPYHGFKHIIDILREASIDPKVISIRITLYRASHNSTIVNTLINAIKNGKQVTAVVELQARFDEEANIFYANKLQEEGAEVIFGVPGLKVHSKLFLITRRENNKSTLYAHIGTGNFNELTARIYCDHSLLTSNKKITREVDKLFNFYRNNYKIGSYNSVIVSPFNTRKKFSSLIHKEIKNAQNGKEAWMILKMNSLVDDEMIEKLYDASNAGVKIKLIVRGICSLVPGIKNKSENIEAISIIDKFLEHSRIFVFCNNGEPKYYLSSGDWMYRNLDHRSEVAVPIYDKDLQEELFQYLSIQLKDNTKARYLNGANGNKYMTSDVNRKIRSQEEIYRWLREKSLARKTVKKDLLPEMVINKGVVTIDV
jgi:polyphosphate kinase